VITLFYCLIIDETLLSDLFPMLGKNCLHSFSGTIKSEIF
jgi:hypothetical protein